MSDDYAAADLPDEFDDDSVESVRSRLLHERAAYDAALRTYRAHTLHLLILLAASLAIGFGMGGGGIGGLVLSFIAFIVLVLAANLIGYVFNREAWRHYSDTGDRPSRSLLSHLEWRLTCLQDLEGARADDQLRQERRFTASDECVTELRAALADAVPARSRTAPIVGAGGVRNGPSSHSQAVPSAELSKPAEDTGRRRFWYIAVGVVVALAVLTVAIGALLSGGNAGGGVDPLNGSCPETARIKGNISGEGERIYHEPGWRYYETTEPETCFETVADAEEAGYRASKVQG